MQEIFSKRRYFENLLSKTFKKVNFIFLFNPVPYNGQSYQKGPGTSDQSLSGYEKNSKKIIYYLTKFDGVI